MNRFCLGFALAAFAPPLFAVTASAESPAAKVGSAHLFPASTVAYAELSDPRGLISTIFDHPLREKIESLSPYQQAVASPQYKQFTRGREMVENHLGMPWRTAIETFAQHSVALAIDAKSQGAAIIVHGKDEASMKMLRDKFITLAQNGKQANKLQAVDYRGIEAHRIDDARFAVYGDRMLITNNSDLGKAILDQMLDGGNDNLLSNQRFQQAAKDRSTTATAWGFVDVETIREAGVADKFYNNQINNPVVELLVGAVQSSLQNTPFATASLTAQTSSVALQLSMPHKNEWIPEQREYFFGSDGNGRGPALLEVDETLFTLSTHRDFAEMWLRAGDLYNAKINDGFAKADATLTTLFAGRDFGEDILGSVEPEVALMVTRQDFTNKLPRPTIKLPALGLVMEMKEPESMTRELRRTFQSMVGFFNVIGAMNGQNQLEMDMEKLSDDAQLVTSTYLPEDDDRDSTDAPILFNFSPTVGFNGKRFVVASTIDLAKQLTLAKTPSPELIDDNTAANLQADTLQKVLGDNREQLVAQNMLKDGNSRAEAEVAIDLLLQVVSYFHDASLHLANQDDQLRVDFSIQVEQ